MLAVLSMAIDVSDVRVTERRQRPRISFPGLGHRFAVLMIIVGTFDLGNSADGSLVLRATARGLSVIGVLGMLITFNLVYTFVSTPAGSPLDRIGRRFVIIGGWLDYALIYWDSRWQARAGTSGRCTRSTESTTE